MKAPGQDRILMVCNTALGAIEDLPFDLRGKRPVPYRADGSSDLGRERKALDKVLAKRIEESLAMVPSPPEEVAQSAVDTALDAIAAEAPNRRALCRNAIDELLNELDSLIIPPGTARATGEELYSVLESSKFIHSRFF